MSIPNAPDPFLEAQADLLSTVQQTQSLQSSYVRIRSLAPSNSSPELVQARQDLENALRDLSADLQDLADSVKAVEGDPFKYGLDEGEVGRRRQLVRDVADQIEDMRDQIPDSTGKTGQRGSQVKKAVENGSAQLPPPSAFNDLDGGREGDYGDDYAEYEQQRQLEMIHQQDEQLDGVFSTVGNLRAQADEMGRELEEQVGMVQDADQIADRVGGKLQTGIKKVGWVIKKNEETWSSCCIGVLILVLIMLLVLVIVL